MSRQAGRHVRERRIPRATGTPVLCIDALHPEDTDFKADAEDGIGRWVSFCEAHGTFVHHTTWRTCREFLSVPEEWCEKCREVAESAEAPKVKGGFTAEERARALETRRRKAEEAAAEREREREEREEAGREQRELEAWSVAKPIVSGSWTPEQRLEMDGVKRAYLEARAQRRAAARLRRRLEEEVGAAWPSQTPLTKLKKKEREEITALQARAAAAEDAETVAAAGERAWGARRDRLARRAFLRGCVAAGRLLHREGGRWWVNDAPVPTGYLPESELREIAEAEHAVAA